MAVEIISRSISTKVWDWGGIELAATGSADAFPTKLTGLVSLMVLLVAHADEILLIDALLSAQPLQSGMLHSVALCSSCSLYLT